MSGVSKNELENNVSAKGQLRELVPYKIFLRGGNKKILFVGNSITWHSYRPEIGWYGDWGMAATNEEGDYVHRTVSMVEEEHGTVDFAIAQIAEWECGITNSEGYLRENFEKILEFAADIIIIRLGENIPKDATPTCKAYFENMIKYFINGTDAKVVITDSFWRNDMRDIMIREIAEENGYMYCRLSDLETDERTMALGLFEHRGVSLHPSNFGMEMIATRIYNVLGDLL